jgi:hypothetical protein
VLRGLLLFTPAVQGLKEARNQDFYQTGSNPMAYYDYAKGKQIPVCITVGASDPNGAGCSFCNPVDPVASYKSVIVPEVNNQFIAAGAGSNVKFTTVAGVSHARPPALNFHDCYTFIESKQTSTTAVAENATQTYELNFGANPSCGLFSFGNSDFGTEEMLNVTVFNVLGETVYQGINKSGTEVDIRSNPDGLYFIEVKAGARTYSGKMMLKK